MNQEDNLNKRTIRFAGWIWLVYIMALSFVDMFFLRAGPRRPLPPYYFANFIAAAIFIIFSAWDFGFQKLGKLYYVVFIIFISVIPILMNHVIAPRLPPGPLSNAEGMALRMFPVLFIGLVLTAWQFRFLEVALYSIAVALVELFIVFFIAPDRPQLLTLFTILNLVRIVSFLSVGFFITRMMDMVRTQQRDLRSANAKLRRSAQTLEELTISRERNRIARELHDTLAHSLTALSLQLETIKAYWTVDSEKAQAMLDNALDITRSGTQETRRTLKSLRASPLDDLGFAMAVQHMAQSAAERAHIELNGDIDMGIKEPPRETQHAIYRIAQEAVENVVKHAQASTVCVFLSQEADLLKLVIEDDGIGFNPKNHGQRGFGLLGMRERAGLVGAQLKIDATPGKGTIVFVSLEVEND